MAWRCGHASSGVAPDELVSSVSASGSGSASASSSWRRPAAAASQADEVDIAIREVWNHNLHEEFRTIRRLVKRYPFVAMDTEFPGVVTRPATTVRSSAEYHYQMLRCNVDLLQVIQLGLSLADARGRTPADGEGESAPAAWQFNFNFDLSRDMYARDSIELLRNAGIQFRRLRADGIEPAAFAELLTASGLVLVDDVTWVTFHSGYDFGYLLKLLTAQPLPADEGAFFELLRLFFPRVYDVKLLLRGCRNGLATAGLQEAAVRLGLRRLGPQHQAGSDALLTGAAFFRLRDAFFGGRLDAPRYCGRLFGLGGAAAAGRLHDDDADADPDPDADTEDTNSSGATPDDA